MRPYEIMIILDPELPEAKVQPTLNRFLKTVKTAKGSIDNTDIWGKRRLAYDILKKSEGIYAVINFTATPEAAKELDRVLNLSELVLRTKLLRAEQVIPVPAKTGAAKPEGTAEGTAAGATGSDADQVSADPAAAKATDVDPASTASADAEQQASED
jgi:small subunit ribosomal protein S6